MKGYLHALVVELSYDQDHRKRKKGEINMVDNMTNKVKELKKKLNEFKDTLDTQYKAFQLINEPTYSIEIVLNRVTTAINILEIQPSNQDLITHLSSEIGNYENSIEGFRKIEKIYKEKIEINLYSNHEITTEQFIKIEEELKK